MPVALPYQLLADAVLMLHALIAAFVTLGLACILVGNLRAWRWVNALWFRLAHLGAIAVVVTQAWFGVACPLTSLEMWLRARAHAESYTGSFMGYWLQRLLYYEAPPWVFTVVYTLFGFAVVLTWWFFPPERKHRGRMKRPKPL